MTFERTLYSNCDFILFEEVINKYKLLCHVISTPHHNQTVGTALRLYGVDYFKISILIIQLKFVNSGLYLTEHGNKQSFWNVLVGRLDYFSFSSNSASKCES